MKMMMKEEGAFRPLQKLHKWNLTLPGNFPGLCRQGGHTGRARLQGSWLLALNPGLPTGPDSFPGPREK